MLAKNLLGPVAEQVLLLENIGTSVQVGPNQLPSVHRLLTEATSMLDMDTPELYIRQSPTPNAYTLAIAGRKPFIVLHTALMDLLTPAEIQAVLAHELGHLKCEHGVWLTVANLLATGTVSVFPFFTQVVEENLMRWLRATELTCDRAALLVTQDSHVVISALMKLAGGSKAYQQELNVEAFLQQARSYDEATRWGLGWYLRNAQSRSLSHPLPVMRAREIDSWASTSEFQKLIRSNTSYQFVPGGAGNGTGSNGLANTSQMDGNVFSSSSNSNSSRNSSSSSSSSSSSASSRNIAMVRTEQMGRGESQVSAGTNSMFTQLWGNKGNK